MFRYLSIAVTAFMLVVITRPVFAKDYDVANSSLFIKKTSGMVTLMQNGKNRISGDIISRELKQGDVLELGPQSEAWLEIVKEGTSERSFLRFSSTTACGSTCSYNASQGIVSVKTKKSGSACMQAVDTYGKALAIAGISKTSDSKTSLESATDVKFVSSTEPEQEIIEVAAGHTGAWCSPGLCPESSGGAQAPTTGLGSGRGPQYAPPTGRGWLGQGKSDGTITFTTPQGEGPFASIPPPSAVGVPSAPGGGEVVGEAPGFPTGTSEPTAQQVANPPFANPGSGTPGSAAQTAGPSSAAAAPCVGNQCQ